VSYLWNTGSPVYKPHLILHLLKIPSTGKTILASIIVEESLTVARLNSAVSIAYFYCKEEDEQRNSFSSVVKSMLAQLLTQNPSLLPYLYDQCLKSGKVTLESRQECSRIFTTVLQAVPRTFIIVDGIDECEEKERKAIINIFTSLIDHRDIDPGKIRVFFVSQALGDIKTALHMAEAFQLKEEHSKLDIENYAVKWSIKIKDRFPNMPEEARGQIVKLVCEGASGMFLFAKLALENLYDQENLENLYEELSPDTFPRGFDQAYVYGKRG
jgi:hypothetical protein